jgi:hypothetical protein
MMLPAMPAPRVEGNVVRIPTAFETRVRMMVIWKAQREAREAVIRKLKAEGRRVSLMSASQINALATAHLREHHRELFAAAEASGVVRNLQQKINRRAVDPKGELVCITPVQNGGPK